MRRPVRHASTPQPFTYPVRDPADPAEPAPDYADLYQAERLMRLQAEERIRELEQLNASMPADGAQRERLEERLHILASARCLLWYSDVEEIGEEALRWCFRFPSEKAAQRFLPIERRQDETFVQAWYRSRLPEDKAASDRLGTASVRAGKDYSQDFRCQMADGSIRWLHEDTQVETVEAGTRWRVVGVCTDITEQREAEDALRLTLRAAGVGWFGLSLMHDIATFSPEYAGLLGLAPEDITTAAAFRARVHPDDLLAFDAALKAGPESLEEVISLPETRFRHADGNWRWHQVTVRITRNAEGGPAWATGIAVDVTRRKQAEIEVEELNARLKRAMTETHHRVKNNLQVIAALIEMHTNATDAPVPLTKVRELGQHVLGLAAIHDLLTEQSRAGHHADTVSSRSALHKLLPLLQTTATGRRIRAHLAEVHIPTRLATALALVANELVSNAIKHAPDGDIDLAMAVEAGVARLVVEDCGPGFPPGFDPEESANTGLDLVRMLATWDLGGSVRFENRPEGGARVTVGFPLRAPGRAIDRGSTEHS